MEIIVDIKNAVYKERLVRCRDCRKWWRTTGSNYGDCRHFGLDTLENGFCSMGETEADRKTEPQTEEWHGDCNTCIWHDGACTIPCCDYEPKDEPKTEREGK